MSISKSEGIHVGYMVFLAVVRDLHLDEQPQLDIQQPSSSISNALIDEAVAA